MQNNSIPPTKGTDENLHSFTTTASSLFVRHVFCVCSWFYVNHMTSRVPFLPTPIKILRWYLFIKTISIKKWIYIFFEFESKSWLQWTGQTWHIKNRTKIFIQSFQASATQLKNVLILIVCFHVSQKTGKFSFDTLIILATA